MKKNNWVIFLVNGIIALLFGLLILFVGQATIISLVRIFGIVLLVAGIILFYYSYRSMKAKKSYVMVMIEAIVGVVIGLIIAINPGQSLNLFLTLVGIWAAIMGLLQIIVAIRLRKKISNPMLFTFNGIITLVLGLLLFYSPMATLGTLLIIIGVLSVLAGILMIYLGFKVKGIRE
jgi:uncharacterized membrane protein HdeD (DUF308 family)